MVCTFWKYFDTTELNIKISASIQMGAEYALHLLWPGEIWYCVYTTNSLSLVKTRGEYKAELAVTLCTLA
jgi:hypothetical protein